MVYKGRQPIYTDELIINEDNICNVITEAMNIHMSNSSDIDYLYKYYKGDQPILYRVKEIRPEITNNIVVNIANAIVEFKVGYLMGEPVQYVSRNDNTDLINKLNEMVFSEDKASKDKELADWFTICGTAYRLILPDTLDGIQNIEDTDEAPFEIYTLDPRNTFVVYSNDYKHRPVLAATYVDKANNIREFSVYTDNMHYVIEYPGAGNGLIKSREPHYLGSIPIIEYPANLPRLGAFEIVLGLLDGINDVESNRVDGVEQFVQSLMVLKGVDIDAEDFRALKELGGLKIPNDADVKYLIQELNQTQTQTLIDDLSDLVYEIVGIPSQGNGNTGDSSNNGAVILKNGWQSAEARAKDTELMFKKSEKYFLKLLLDLTNAYRTGFDVKLSDIEIKFTRRNYEDIQTKAQVLAMMLNNDKIAPKLAFESSGLFIDPENAYLESMDYYESKKAADLEALNTRFDNLRSGDDTDEEETEIEDV